MRQEILLFCFSMILHTISPKLLLIRHYQYDHAPPIFYHILQYRLWMDLWDELYYHMTVPIS